MTPLISNAGGYAGSAQFSTARKDKRSRERGAGSAVIDLSFLVSRYRIGFLATESTENTDPHHLFPRTRNCHERKGGDGRGTSVQGGVGFRGFRVFRGYHHTGGRSLSTRGLRPALARSRNVGYNLHRPGAARRSRSGAEVPSGPLEWGARPIRHHQRQRPR